MEKSICPQCGKLVDPEWHDHADESTANLDPLEYAFHPGRFSQAPLTPAMEAQVEDYFAHNQY